MVPHKHLLVQSAAREKILHGVMAVADAVHVTLGPKSNCVLIERKWSPRCRTRSGRLPDSSEMA
jgi:chaperonin GroEL (HSP60 family)